MATSALTASISDASPRGAPATRPAFPPDPRAFDFSFAFNNPDFSDRCLVLQLHDEDDLEDQDNADEADPVWQQTRADGTQCAPSRDAGAPESPDCGGRPDAAEARRDAPRQQEGEGPARGEGQGRAGPPGGPQGTAAEALEGRLEAPKGQAEEAQETGERSEEQQSQSDTSCALSHTSSSASSSSSSSCSLASSSDASVLDEPWQTETRQLHVMTAILVSQSDFFRSLFSAHWDSACRGDLASRRAAPITLKLATHEEKPFLELMRFIYTGRVSVDDDPEALLHLLLVANKYGVLSCVNVCAHHLREVPLSLDICCVLLRVCSGVVLSESAAFLIASSSSFLVSRFGQLESAWKSPEFVDLPLEALEAILGSDDVCVTSEETVFSALLHWVRHRALNELEERKALVARLADKVRFPAMDAETLQDVVMLTPEADSPAVKALIMEALWFKCSSFERQQELVMASIRQHRRYVRRRQLSIHSEVLLQDCYMLQPGQAILLSGGAWVCGKLFSLKVMRVAAPVGGSDFGLFLQASQRSPVQDKVLDDSVTVEFSFKVKEWPAGMFVQQKQSASHTFKGLFRERGYRSLLNPWNEVMKDNSKFFRNGTMYIKADLRVIHPGESMSGFE